MTRWRVRELLNKLEWRGSHRGVKQSRVVVQWPEGLHLRRAASVVQAARRFRSTIQLKCGEKVANVRSVISLIALCATLGTALEVEAAGEDESDATQAIERLFSSVEDNDAGAGLPREKR